MRNFLFFIFIGLGFSALSQATQQDVDYNRLWHRGHEKIYYLLPDTVHPYTGKCHLNFPKTKKVAVTGQFINGLKTGEWKWIYKNGTLKRTTEYKKGMKHGKTTYYYKNGKKKSEINFYMDKNIKQVSWDEKGKRVENPSFHQFKN